MESSHQGKSKQSSTQPQASSTSAAPSTAAAPGTSTSPVLQHQNGSSSTSTGAASNGAKFRRSTTTPSSTLSAPASSNPWSQQQQQQYRFNSTLPLRLVFNIPKFSLSLYWLIDFVNHQNFSTQGSCWCHHWSWWKYHQADHSGDSCSRWCSPKGELNCKWKCDYDLWKPRELLTGVSAHFGGHAAGGSLTESSWRFCAEDSRLKQSHWSHHRQGRQYDQTSHAADWNENYC